MYGTDEREETARAVLDAELLENKDAVKRLVEAVWRQARNGRVHVDARFLIEEVLGEVATGIIRVSLVAEVNDAIDGLTQSWPRGNPPITS
jgi:hypothetical protein